MRTHYSLLDVTYDASEGEIRQAYRTLSKQMHPDAGGPKSAEERKTSERAFQALKDAHDVLMNPVERHAYDLSLDVGPLHAKLMHRVTDNFLSALVAASESPHPYLEDPLEIVRRGFLAARAPLYGRIGLLQSRLRYLSGCAGKVSRHDGGSGGVDMFDRALRQLVHDIQEEVAQVSRQIEEYGRLLELASKFRWWAPQVQPGPPPLAPGSLRGSAPS